MNSRHSPNPFLSPGAMAIAVLVVVFGILFYTILTAGS